MAPDGRPEIDPKEIARAAFPTAFRGYDQESVRHYLRGLAASVAKAQQLGLLGDLHGSDGEDQLRVDELEQEAAQLQDRVEELEDLLQTQLKQLASGAEAPADGPPRELDEAALIAMLGQETARVLETARSAAADIVSRAEADASATTSEAELEARQARQEADRVLSSARAEADEIINLAREKSKQSHERIKAEIERSRTKARSDADDVLSEARGVADSEVQAARQHAGEIVIGAEQLRTDILGDLAQRQAVGQRQIARLVAARDRLAGALAEARNNIDDVEAEVQLASPDSDELDLTSSPDALDADAPRAAQLEALLARLEEAQRDQPMVPSSVAASGAASTAAAPVDSRRHGPEVSDARPPDARRSDQDGEGAGGHAVNGAAPLDEVEQHDAGDTDQEAVDGGPANGRLGGLRPNGVEPAEEVLILDDGGLRNGTFIAAGAGAPADGDAAGAEVVNTGDRADGDVRADGFAVDDLDDDDLAVDDLDNGTLAVDDLDDGTLDDGTLDDDSGDDGFGGDELDGLDPLGADPLRWSDATLLGGGRGSLHRAAMRGDLPRNTPYGGSLPVAFETRDAALGRAGAGFRRRLRRAVNDDQSDVLDRLRAGRGTIKPEELPPVGEQLEAYVEALRPVLIDMVSSGGELLHCMAIPEQAVENLCLQLARHLVDCLRTPTVESIESATSDDREVILDPIRAVYRDFRNAALPDLIDDALHEAFALGVYYATDPADRLIWVPDPRLDPDPICEENSAAPPLPKGTHFPSGHARPLSMPGCRCLALPLG